MTSALDPGRRTGRRRARGGTSYDFGAMRGELIVEAYAALDVGDVGPLEALLDPQVRWIGVGDSWGETPT
jgi:hypothetical protein